MKSKLELNSCAMNIRKKLNEDPFSPIDIFGLINNLKNFTLVFYPMSEKISGMCIREKDSSIIAINSTLSYGRQRFTGAHELYHLFFQENFRSVVCEREINDSKSEDEKEADEFASYLLAPYEALKAYTEQNKLGYNHNWTIPDVISIEQFFQLSHQATLYRLVSDGYIKLEASYSLRSHVIEKAVRLGYDDKLYKPSQEDKQYFTIGEYIKKVEELKSKDKISNGKYDELLLDAFRADIVYNLGEEGKELDD